MCRLVINPSGAWLFLSERSRYCQGVCHGFIPHIYRIDSLLLRCGALGILARRLRICGMIPSLREGQGCQSGGHASGLTIQLSQGQGRQPRVPQGGAFGTRACRAHKLLGYGECVASYVSPLRVSTLFCTFFVPSFISPCVRRCKAPHGTLGDRRRPRHVSAC